MITLRACRWLLPLLTVSMTGCVLGYGHCKFLEPVKSSLTGRVYFREYRDDQRFDRAPILLLDRTEYIYVPAPGKQCVSAHELQLIPVGDLPDEVADKAHVVVEGTLVAATQSHQHTRFVFNVASVRLIK